MPMGEAPQLGMADPRLHGTPKMPVGSVAK
jgi:hypothetical protein